MAELLFASPASSPSGEGAENRHDLPTPEGPSLSAVPSRFEEVSHVVTRKVTRLVTGVGRNTVDVAVDAVRFVVRVPGRILKGRPAGERKRG